MQGSFGSRLRVRLAAMLSSVLLLLAVLPAAAHEVFPAIADMTRQGDTLAFRVEAGVEAFLAGVDLEGLEDISTAEAGDAQYDLMRALPPAELAARFEAFFPEFARGVTVEAGGQALPLSFVGLDVPPVGDVEQPRRSLLRFSAALPEGAETIVVGWNAAYGDLVLRQNGVPAPYDGYLTGGALTPPIELGGGGAAEGWSALLRHLPAGMDSVVPLGLDHVLFALALVFGAARLWPLIWLVPAFAVGQSAALVLTGQGLLSVPPAVVEPLIAATAVLVASEAVLSDGRPRLWRAVPVLAFGLLHGLGLAADFGAARLPGTGSLPALAGFGLGAVIGLLAVISGAYLCVVIALRARGQDGGARGPGALLLGLAVLAVPALAVPVAQMGAEARPMLLPLLAAAGVLLGLSAGAVIAGGRDAYWRMVAMPASVLIALSGAWLVVERAIL